MNSEQEQILDESFVRASPPRLIDFFTRSTIFFSGFMSQFGWLFFGFGLIFFWIFGGAAGLKDLTAFDGNWMPAQGNVEAITATSSSINEAYVYRNNFSYSVNGNSYSGESYTTGSPYRTGQQVDIEYRSKNPDKARIKGTRTAHFPFAISLITLIFPIIGLVFLLIGMRRNIRANYLMKYGVFTTGQRLSKTATSTTINDQPVYKYEFTFTAGGQSWIAKCSTHQTQRVEDEKEEIILYDERNPELSVVYDSIEGFPPVDKVGNISSVPASNIFYLFVPGLAMLGHGLFILFYFFI